MIGDVLAVTGDGAAPAGRDRAIGQVYRRATAILNDMLEIGNKADTGSVAVVAHRLQTAKRAPAEHEQACQLV